MASWAEFEAAAPELAARVRSLLDGHVHKTLATLRRDGSPRITGTELRFDGGELWFGSMWRSNKALDLLRDPRCVVHSVTCDRMGTDGDLKLYGRMADVHEPALRHAYQAAIKARIDWQPDEPEFHLFSLDIESAGYTVFEENAHRALAWDPERGLRTLSLG